MLIDCPGGRGDDVVNNPGQGVEIAHRGPLRRYEVCVGLFGCRLKWLKAPRDVSAQVGGGQWPSSAGPMDGITSSKPMGLTAAKPRDFRSGGPRRRMSAE